jgi:hypothetical protein
MTEKLPQLKMKIVTRHEVNYNDLDEFVTTFYGQEFMFSAVEEAGNDSSHTFCVEKEEIDEYDQNKLDEFRRTGRGQYLTSTILTDLCNGDLIPEGDYLINVCW